MLNREMIFRLIDAERLRQDARHPEWYEGKALAVLVEEVGEVAKALNEMDKVELIRELVQVAAVSVRWLENM
jgi:NTP pyrophosphatase (non-canonical NTP hydrolase)